ncbi:cupin domain-containing protein [Rhizobium sp.]|uniref:cupin domain-containing protein n=1 Tax=Rhizobium sp. TaxID=391 RepID=UPI0034C64867
MSQFIKAAVSKPGEGELIKAFGSNLVRIGSPSTNGALSILEVTLLPGDGTPLHVHEREDETFRVLEGRMAFWCGEEHFELQENGVAVLPRGIPHRIECIGQSPCTVMVILTPGGFEAFFAAAAKDPASDPAELAASYGVRFLPV